jgi:dTDP-4-dehydrorhamnose 3,5-epimerase
MIFTETMLPGAFLVDAEPHEDTRGFFARAWCAREFEQHGLTTRVAQVNMASNLRRGTLRGMHYQSVPHAETKFVRCTRGALYDVIVDLRPNSPTYTQWFGIELSFANRRALYVPEGFAHGYLTLVDETEAFYQVSEFYAPDAEQGVRWNDPAFAIEWPLEVHVISEKDLSWPDFHAVDA